MLTRSQAIDFLKNRPAEYAHMLGFTKLTDLHNGWIREMLIGTEDATLMAHRGSYKTTCVSVALAMTIFLLPKIRTVFIRKTDTDVKEVIKQVQKILQDPHTQYFVQAIYGAPLKLTTQSTTEINTNLISDVKGTSQLLGMGIGGSLTGKHFDRIFTDDISNMKDRVSRAERDRTKLAYQELQNIKNRSELGKIYNTGTPWHEDDVGILMPAPKKYTCYESGLMTDEEIQEVKEKMTPSLFAANYELRFIASEDVIFTNPQLNADISLIYDGQSHVDAAYYGEDYTAFTIVAIHDGKFYVYGKCWRKHIDDVMPEIADLHNKFLCRKLFCETNADKGYVAKAFRDRGLRVSTYHERENKHVKITTYLKFNWKDVIFVEGTDEKYINQICDYNENAEHDDCPDSLASLIRKLERRKNREKQYDI